MECGPPPRLPAFPGDKWVCSTCGKTFVAEREAVTLVLIWVQRKEKK